MVVAIDRTLDFDERVLEACLVMYEQVPNEQIVSLVRVWIMNGDDPVLNAHRLVTDGAPDSAPGRSTGSPSGAARDTTSGLLVATPQAPFLQR